MNDSPAFMDVASAAAALKSREISIPEILEATLERIDAVEPQINAWASVQDRAILLNQAKELQENLDSDSSLLSGIPFGVKDMIDTETLPTEAASAVLEGRVPTKTAHCVADACAAGGLMIGKTHTHEFAFGVRTPQTMNPWDYARTPGGSSGGSAAAVAAGMALWTFGTDTLGSVRMPATMCGVVGLKPTTGTISTSGVIPLSQTLDCVGFLTRTVADARVVFSSLASDHRMPTSVSTAQQLRIGVLSPETLGRLEPGVEEAYEACINELSKTHSVQQIQVESLEAQVQVGFDFMLVEGAHWHKDLLASRGNLYEPGIFSALQSGLEVPGTVYYEALLQKRRITATYESILDEVDVILTPGTPYVAPEHSAEGILWPDGVAEPLENTMCRFTAAASLTGLPALSVPTGLVNGLPTGVQLIGRRHEEHVILNLGSIIEQPLSPSIVI